MEKQLPPQQQVQAEVVQIPITPSPRFSKKLIAIITFFILITICIGGYIFLIQKNKPAISQSKLTTQPSPTLSADSVLNWNTYTNKEFGISFQYPQAMKIIEKKYLSRTDSKTSVTFVSLIGKTSSFDFTFEPNLKNLTLEQWHNARVAEEKTRCQIDCHGFSAAPEKIQLGTIQVLREDLASVIGTVNVYLPLNDTTILWASGTSSKETGGLEMVPTSATKALLSQILSTMKLTDQKNSSSQFKPLLHEFLTEKFLGIVDYPAEMRALSPGSLQPAACSLPSSFDSGSDYGASLPPSIRAELLERAVSQAFACDIKHAYLVIYESGGGGGGSKSASHIAIAQNEPFMFKDVTMIPSGAPYFACHTVHAITKDDLLYVQCGGGDVGYSESIYRIALAAKRVTRLIACDGKPFGDGQMLERCIDSTDKEIFRSGVRKLP